MPKISVIMGTHNGEKTICKSIESILKQTFTDFEFIICDDCSTDNTIKILEEYQRKDNRIIILKNENKQGLAFSLNRCIDLSNGIYIARMDDDDFSYSERFKIQNDFLDINKEYSIVGCCRRTFDDHGIWNTLENSGEITKYDIIKGNIFTHPTVMIRHEDLNKSGNYTVSKRTMRGQDFDLWCKMYANGYKGYILPDILFEYYEDRNGIKEIKTKYRINNFLTHIIWRKKMKLSIIYDIYAIKELIAILIPNKLLVKYKKIKYKGGKNE